MIWARAEDDIKAMETALAGAIPHVGEGNNFGPAAFAAVVSAANNLQAVAAFHEWQPDHRTVQFSIAAWSPMWARPAIIAEFLRYAFEGLGVYKIWTSTPADNTPAIKVNKHIGFTREAILRHQYGPKRHAVIMSMTSPEWKRSKYHG